MQFVRNAINMYVLLTFLVLHYSCVQTFPNDVKNTNLKKFNRDRNDYNSITSKLSNLRKNITLAMI